MAKTTDPGDGYAPGVTVLISRAHDHTGSTRTEEAVIARVTRTRVYVTQYGRETPFHRDTGYSLGDPATYRIETPEAYQDRLACHALTSTLTKRGVTIAPHLRLDAHALQQILDIIDAA